MTDIERQIAALLHEEADRAALTAGMYERVLRRARIRRVVTATVAGLALIAVVMAGVVTVGALQSPSSDGPAGPGESPGRSSNRREDGDGVRSIGPEVVVGRGTVSGKSWALVANESDAGLCVDLHLGGISHGGCGYGVPERGDLGFSVGSQTGLSKRTVHGVVSKRVAGLVVRLEGGKESEWEIIKDPRNFDVNFFAEFLPPNAEGIVEARDDEGAVLQRKRLTPL